MKSLNRYILLKIFRLLCVSSILLYSFTSQQFVYALMKDCGPHKVKLCGEHENKHLILKHADTHESDHFVTDKSDKNDMEHDHSHQLTDIKPYNIINLKKLIKLNILYISFVQYKIIPLVSNNSNQKYVALKPPWKDLILGELKTVRLLI